MSAQGPFYLGAESTPLHLAAVVADQFVIDAYFQFYAEHEYDVGGEVSVSRLLVIHDKRCN